MYPFQFRAVGEDVIDGRERGARTEINGQERITIGKASYQIP